MTPLVLVSIAFAAMLAGLSLVVLTHELHDRSKTRA